MLWASNIACPPHYRASIDCTELVSHTGGIAVAIQSIHYFTYSLFNGGARHPAIQRKRLTKSGTRQSGKRSEIRYLVFHIAKFPLSTEWHGVWLTQLGSTPDFAGGTLWSSAAALWWTGLIFTVIWRERADRGYGFNVVITESSNPLLTIELTILHWRPHD